MDDTSVKVGLLKVMVAQLILSGPWRFRSPSEAIQIWREEGDMYARAGAKLMSAVFLAAADAVEALQNLDASRRPEAARTVVVEAAPAGAGRTPDDGMPWN